MDVAGALTPDECMDELELDKIRDKPWHITCVSASPPSPLPPPPPLAMIVTQTLFLLLLS